MKIRDAEVAARSLTELSESCKDFSNAIKGIAPGAAAAQKLWREGNKSKLVKIGMAIFLFPEPTPTSEIIGSGVMAVGAIQQAIKSRAIYVEDIPKTLLKTFNELRATKIDFRV